MMEDDRSTEQRLLLLLTKWNRTAGKAHFKLVHVCLDLCEPQVRTKHNGAIQKGVLSCFISGCVRYMKGEWLHHLGIRLRQRSLYYTSPVSVLFWPTHFPGLCLGLCHIWCKKVWINLKSRCGCIKTGKPLNLDFFFLVNPIRGRERMSTSKTPLSSVHDVLQHLLGNRFIYLLNTGQIVGGGIGGVQLVVTGAVTGQAGR